VEVAVEVGQLDRLVLGNVPRGHVQRLDLILTSLSLSNVFFQFFSFIKMIQLGSNIVQKKFRQLFNSGSTKNIGFFLYNIVIKIFLGPWM